MIAKPLVLVLGAGASAPYGFPTGWELTQSIITGLDSADDKLYKVLCMECGFTDYAIKFFQEDLDKSQHHSVDAFLEHRKDHREVGKAAIAASLIPCENISKFSRTYKAKDGDQRWYSYLLQHFDTHPDKFASNEIAIVTFNYDRSLEYFLFQSLMARHGIDNVVAGELVQAFPIIHVYGSLCAPDFFRGARPTRPYDTVTFEAPLARSLVKAAAGQLQIAPEARAEASAFGKVQEILSRAETVCFIGFGYDPVNMERLGLKSLKKKFRFIGTGHNLNDDSYGFARHYLKDICYDQAYIYLNRDALWVIQNAGVFR